MALFLTILEGESPATAKPILASRDERLIRLVADELSKRLGNRSGKLLELKSGQDKEQ